jgi:hypothetical protein
MQKHLVNPAGTQTKTASTLMTVARLVNMLVQSVRVMCRMAGIVSLRDVRSRRKRGYLRHEP